MKNKDSIAKCNALCTCHGRWGMVIEWVISIQKCINAAKNPILNDKNTIDMSIKWKTASMNSWAIHVSVTEWNVVLNRPPKTM